MVKRVVVERFGGPEVLKARSSRPRATSSGTPRQRDATVRKQPYYLHSTDPNGVLSFAGLYELWREPSKDKSDPTRWLRTAVIITTDAAGPAGDIHDRTPLILPLDRVNAWLDPTRTEPDQIYEVLDGIVLQPLAVRPVSTRVNRVGADGADLVEPLTEHLDEPLQLTLTARAAER